MRTNTRSKFNRIPATLICLSVLSLFAGGCKTPSRVAFDAEKKGHINTSTGFVGLTQQEIAADINQSNLAQAAGGGLLFSVIDAGINNSRAKDAEKDVVPVRDALIGYDVGQTLKTDLVSSLKPTSWLKLRTIEVRQLSDEKALRSWLPSTEGNVMLLVRPYYRLNAGFNVMTISATVSVQGPPPADDKEKLGAPLYSNTLVCAVTLPGSTGKMTRVDAAQLWSGNSGRNARLALNEGLSEIARMIAYDLELPNPPEKKIFKAPEDAETRAPNPNIPGYEGYVTHTEKDHVWVRMPFGELYSMRK